MERERERVCVCERETVRAQRRKTVMQKKMRKLQADEQTSTTMQ